MTMCEDKLDCIVADDEPFIRERIECLARQAGLIVRGSAASGAEALRLIDELAPAIAFLDIRMPGMDGLQTVEKLSGLSSPPVIIFVTAYAEHALAAFELAAIDYVVKPVEADRFVAAVNRAKMAALGRMAQDTLGRLKGALQCRRPDALTFRSGSRFITVPPSDVMRFAALDDYVEAHLATSSYLLSVTMNTLENVFDSPPFLRVHRSHIVNLDHVTAFSHAVRGRMILTMSDGTAIPVSRARAESVRKTLTPIRKTEY